MPQELTIYIVEDDQDYLNLLVKFISCLDYPVRSFTSAEQFLIAFKEEPGCLILDLRMPKLSGLEVQSALNKINVNLPIIFLSAFGDIETVANTMKAGAFDFLTKPFKQEILIAAVNRAIKYAEKNANFNKARDVFILTVNKLTQKEKQVMHLMVKGDSTKAIAEQLGISKNTVDIHRARVIKKMELSSLIELVKLSSKYKSKNLPVSVEE
jgi:two-component system, LuxR family, response regulator FixJ